MGLPLKVVGSTIVKAQILNPTLGHSYAGPSDLYQGWDLTWTPSLLTKKVLLKLSVFAGVNNENIAGHASNASFDLFYNDVLVHAPPNFGDADTGQGNPIPGADSGIGTVNMHQTVNLVAAAIAGPDQSIQEPVVMMGTLPDTGWFTPGHTYWFDLVIAMAAAGSFVSYSNAQLEIIELT